METEKVLQELDEINKIKYANIKMLKSIVDNSPGNKNFRHNIGIDRSGRFYMNKGGILELYVNKKCGTIHFSTETTEKMRSLDKQAVINIVHSFKIFEDYYINSRTTLDIEDLLEDLNIIKFNKTILNRAFPKEQDQFHMGVEFGVDQYTGEFVDSTNGNNLYVEMSRRGKDYMLTGDKESLSYIRLEERAIKNLENSFYLFRRGLEKQNVA